jgi:predicted kinase
MSGVAGSGKSTIAETIAKDGAIIVSSDKIRENLFATLDESVQNKECNRKVFEELYKQVQEKLEKQRDVIIDATNLSQKKRMYIYERFKDMVDETTILSTFENLDTLYERNRNRPLNKIVPDEVMYRQYLSMQPPRKGIDCDNYVVYGKRLSVFEEIRKYSLINNKHDSIHHLETIGEHIDMVAKLTANKSLTDIVYGELSTSKAATLASASYIHDLGKFVSKQTKVDNNGNTYYSFAGHENVSAMYALVLREGDDVVTLVQHHMKAHNLSEKTINRYKLHDYIKLLDKLSKYDNMGRINGNLDNLLTRLVKNKNEIIYLTNGEYVNLRFKHRGIDFTNQENRLARGLLMDTQGNIVVRSFEKFFNYCELDSRGKEYQELAKCYKVDNEEEVIAYPKLDGTMVAISYHDGGLIGTTSTSMQTDWVSIVIDKLKDNEKLIEYLKSSGTSLIFEYTAPDNTIVVKYDKEEITLLAEVENKPDAIVNISRLDHLEKLGLKVIKPIKTSLKELLQWQKEKENVEGWVVQNKLGYLIKFKTDWWFENNIEPIEFTKKGVQYVIQLCLEDKIDDVIALINQRENKKEQWVHEVAKFVDDIIRNAYNYATEYSTTKEIAELDTDQATKSLAITILKGNKDIANDNMVRSIYKVVKENFKED